MDYNKLQTFAIVAELGSLTAAAYKLRRTQPAITQQVQLLEEELGLRLLERKGGRVLVSTDGARIASLAKEKLGEIRDAITGMQNAIESVEGHITLGVLDDFGTNFDVAKALGSFAQKYPQVTFKLRLGNSPRVEKELVQNRTDLGILVAFRDRTLFVRAPIQKSWHSLYASAEYYKRIEPVRTCRDLLDKDLIDLDERFMAIGTFIGKNAPNLVSKLKRRSPNIVAPDLDLVRRLLLSGYGIAMLPDFLVESELKAKKVVRVLAGLKPLSGELDIAYRTNKTLRLCEALFVRHLKEANGAFNLG